MTRLIDRRSLLLGSAALAAAGYAAAASPALAKVTERSATTLRIGRRTIEVNGRAASVFGIEQPDGTPGLTLEPGERFKVALVNSTQDETIVHWHGQTAPYLQDGVVDRNVSAIAGGERREYDFEPTPGTHWMHSHLGLQEQALLAAPLIVRTAEDARADLQEVTVLLHDFSFRAPEEILAGLTGSAGQGGHHGMHGMDGAPSEMPAMSHGGMAMDLNDVEHDAFLANDRTLGDPQIVRVERGGRVRLRMINAAASSAFWIDLGDLDGTLVTVDGVAVEPVAGRSFPMAIAQRIDVILDIPASGAFPILAQVEGKAERTGVILATAGARIEKISDLAPSTAPPVDLSLEERLRALSPLAGRPADVTAELKLTGAMAPYAWSFNDEAWPSTQRAHLRRGQRVVIEMQNATMMAHPIHLHGHQFQVIGINGRSFQGAVRDTVLVPMMGTVRIAFDADNPGRWLLHCHNLYHMATGMMTELVYDTYV
jgi:FtsP/CotA-like multicopper oxidase with cupredoxin domain